MRFSSLGSGSAGNAMVVEQGKTRVLLDCGFGAKETVARLARIGLQPEDISAVIVTHEHDDHARGAFKFAAQQNIPVLMTYGTLKMSERYLPNADLKLQVIDSHCAFILEDLHISPFPVPHDAREPTQFTFSDGSVKLGVLTDVGTVTPHMVEMLSGCDGLVLECNHDAEMLKTGPYTAALKKRVGGEWGHLDNQTSASLLASLDNQRLKHIIAAHLSAKNNTPALAKMALSKVLSCAEDWVGIADQALGFSWREI